MCIQTMTDFSQVYMLNMSQEVENIHFAMFFTSYLARPVEVGRLLQVDDWKVATTNQHI